MRNITIASARGRGRGASDVLLVSPSCWDLIIARPWLELLCRKGQPCPLPKGLLVMLQDNSTLTLHHGWSLRSGSDGCCIQA